MKAPPPAEANVDGGGGEVPLTEDELRAYYEQHSPDKVDGVHDVYEPVVLPSDRNRAIALGHPN